MEPLPTTLAQMETRAAEVLATGPYDYYAGGAGDETTLRDNRAAWGRYALRPRVMVDVSHCDPSTTVLGRRMAHPVLVAPVAYQRYATADGELATARAAAAASATMVLSSQSTTEPRAVAATEPDAPKWFQLYVFKDRGVTDDLIDAARDGGFEALVLTVDFPVGGKRERDTRTGFRVDLPIRSNRTGSALPPERIHALHDPSLTWDAVAEIGKRSGLPVVVKGVLRPDDARLAVEAGAAGLIVSNHGGRQLDTVVSGIDALGPIVDEVGSELDVLVDGGVRRGWDVVKALAIGAKAVLVGRPVVWGLACGGEAGATRVLQILIDELTTSLALTGCPRASDLDRSYVQPAPWARP